MQINDQELLLKEFGQELGLDLNFDNNGLTLTINLSIIL